MLFFCSPGFHQEKSLFTPGPLSSAVEQFCRFDLYHKTREAEIMDKIYYNWGEGTEKMGKILAKETFPETVQREMTFRFPPEI